MFYFINLPTLQAEDVYRIFKTVPYTSKAIKITPKTSPPKTQNHSTKINTKVIKKPLIQKGFAGESTILAITKDARKRCQAYKRSLH